MIKKDKENNDKERRFFTLRGNEKEMNFGLKKKYIKNDRLREIMKEQFR